jgi:hypothetical protein
MDLARNHAAEAEESAHGPIAIIPRFLPFWDAGKIPPGTDSTFLFQNPVRPAMTGPP